jgi:hypothetical protein
MSGGYRSIILALVGWLILAAAPDANSAAGHKTKTAQNVQNPAPPTAPTVAKAVEPVPPSEYYRPCEQPYTQRESDLCAQWKAADSANEAAVWAKWQLIISSFGLAGLLYTLRLTRKGTRIAVEAIEAQIAIERPVMHLSQVALSRALAPQEDPPADDFRMHMEWHLTNQGKSGCWLEKVCIYPQGLAPGDRFPREWNTKYEFPLVAYVKPDRGWGNAGNEPKYDSAWTFTADEVAAIKATKRIYVFGYSIYRDAGGVRWRTGFAYLVPLNDDFEGSVQSPVPYHALWEDRRLRPKKWYQWIWDERAEI